MFTINDNIESGDIILTRSNTFSGKAIAELSSGEFSHICIAINKFKVIEAVPGKGVCVTPINRIVADYDNQIMVLRHIRMSDSIKSNLEMEASTYIMNGYNYKGVALFHTVGSSGDGKEYFCSQLVSSLLREVGIELFPEHDHRVSPNSYCHHVDLIDVSSNCVSETIRSKHLDGEFKERSKRYSAEHHKMLELCNIITEKYPSFFKDGIAHLGGIMQVLLDSCDDPDIGEKDAFVTSAFDKLSFIDMTFELEDYSSVPEFLRLARSSTDELNHEQRHHDFVLDYIEMRKKELIDAFTIGSCCFSRGLNFGERLMKYAACSTFSVFVLQLMSYVQIGIISKLASAYDGTPLVADDVTKFLKLLDRRFSESIQSGIKIDISKRVSHGVYAVTVCNVDNSLQFRYEAKW